MKKSIIFIISIFFFICLMSTPVYAGGGRFEIQNYNGTGNSGPEGIYIQGRIYTEYPYPSVGEKAEFRVKNPRPGDRCTTTDPKTDQNGQIFGQCFATDAGSILIYIHSDDKGEDSSEYILYFVSPPTNIPTRIPTNIPQATLKPTVVRDAIRPSTIEKNITSPTQELRRPSIAKEKTREVFKTNFIEDTILRLKDFLKNLFTPS